MDADSFLLHTKTDNIYKEIAEDVENRCNTSNYELFRALPKEKNKQVIGLIKYKLGRTIMTKCVELRAKTQSYLINDNSEIKKKRHKKVCHQKKQT